MKSLIRTIALALACTMAVAPAVWAQTADGSYVGPVNSQTPGKCFSTITTLTVVVHGPSVTGNWVVSSGKVAFSGTMNGSSFTAQKTLPSGESVSIHGTLAGTTMTAGFSGTSGCSFAGTLTRK